MGDIECHSGTAASREMLIARTLIAVERLRAAAQAIEKELADVLDGAAPESRASAYNLAHYLAVRRHDIRELQHDLGRLGLSSLGRMEAHVMASLVAVLQILHELRRHPTPCDLGETPIIDFDSGDRILAEHAAAILGMRPRGRNSRIMVTMPSEAANDPALIHSLLAHGMDIMRINCAHDDAGIWGNMVRNLRRAEEALGRNCKVSFDLAGPKLRTGPIRSTEGVAKWRPQRNALGQCVAPARVAFVSGMHEADGVETPVPVPAEMLRKVKAGDTVALVDARSRKRRLTVVQVTDRACICEADATAYVTQGTPLEVRRKGRLVKRFEVGMLPPSEQAIDLAPGDTLMLVKGDDVVGRNAVRNDAGTVLEPAQVGCALGEVFSSVRIGERIYFDDGKFAGRIADATHDSLRIDITSVAGGHAKLRGEKGINLPDTDLQLPALSTKDLEDLEFAVRHGDMVALSFVQRSEDVADLISALDRLGADRHGIVLKIETARAFERLPGLLLAAMRHAPVAVMVARGDLGVEMGFERLSEVQEEILWMCEAAHIPVIWATQVLESLAKGGMPSRAEVTDAAMSSRAECVMLNKGPYILQTMDFLRDVLSRMEAHQAKKTSMLRRLSISSAAVDHAVRVTHL